MSELNTDSVDKTDDLAAFEAEFYGTKAETENEVETSEDVDSENHNESDADETEVDTSDDEDETPDGEAEPADAEEDDDEEEETDLFKTKRRKSAQERIKELTAARREAERREAELARRLEALESSQGERNKNDADTKPVAAMETGAPDPDATLEDGKPKYPLGEFDPHYIRDLTRFTIAIETKAAKEEEAKAAREQQMQDAEKQLQTDWSAKLEASRETLPDFGDKVVVLEDTFRDLDPNYGKYLAATIMSMDKGPQVLHYLATNLGEAKKIVANGPTAATLALGRIEARFDTPASNDKKTRVTSAPPPPPTNRGRGGGSNIADDTDNLDAFEKKFFAKR